LGLAVLHAAAELRALRPLLGERPGRRPSVLFFALPALLYLALLPWAGERRQPDGDEPYYLLLAHSLAYDGDADLANNYAAGDWRFFLDRAVTPQPGDPVGPEGQVYSRHNLLLPLALALPYRLAGKTGALAAMSLLAALLAWLVLRLAGRAFPERPGEALLAYGVLALAPPLLTYAHQVWVEVPAAVLLAMALDRLLDRIRARSPGPGRSGSRWRTAAGWAALALPLLLLPLLKIRFALLALPLLALAFYRASRGDRRARRGLVGILLLFAAAGAAVLVYNRVRFGNALKIHSWSELALPAMSVRGTVEGSLGLFWDAAFGLFAFAPLWLLVVPALALAAVRWREPAGPFPVQPAGWLMAVALPYLLLVAPRAEWYGGWSPPFRYGVALLPLLALVLVPLLAERHRAGARVVLGALGAATVALALVWLAAPGATYHLADGRTRLLDALSAGLGADAARLFPSYVRPRLASWLWPPLSVLAVTLVWWLPRGRAAARELGAGALAAGAALALLAAAAVPALAAVLPPQRVELEDPWVVHHGGHVHPETWVVARSHYRGGWVVRPGEAVEIPLGPAAGGRVRLALELRFGRNNPDPLDLEVLAGDTVLTRWRPRAAGVWRRVELGPLDLPPGEPLVLRAAGPPRAGRQNGLLLDRLELEWL
ncbi:MAG TPA: hypothetical protein VLF66_17460, partial [Thermoanaerobaculia bacterium]|nr:hypothetical protein [Thermoanaerobaculia bacterium]